MRHIARGVSAPIDLGKITIPRGDKGDEIVWSFNSIHWGLASKVNVTAEKLRYAESVLVSCALCMCMSVCFFLCVAYVDKGDEILWLVNSSHWGLTKLLVLFHMFRHKQMCFEWLVRVCAIMIVDVLTTDFKRAYGWARRVAFACVCVCRLHVCGECVLLYVASSNHSFSHADGWAKRFAIRAPRCLRWPMARKCAPTSCAKIRYLLNLTQALTNHHHFFFGGCVRCAFS